MEVARGSAEEGNAALAVIRDRKKKEGLWHVAIEQLQMTTEELHQHYVHYCQQYEKADKVDGFRSYKSKLASKTIVGIKNVRTRKHKGVDYVVTGGGHLYDDSTAHRGSALNPKGAFQWISTDSGHTAVTFDGERMTVDYFNSTAHKVYSMSKANPRVLRRSVEEEALE